MEQTDTSDLVQPSSRRKRRRIILALVIVAVLAALVLTPPFINVNRYRRRIAVTLSQSLGRPVHLDNVSLHVLPMPGLTLQNLVVSEDPAFGYEPVIRANRVDATLRVSSLWRRQVEFSTVRFDVDEQGAGPSVNIVRNAAGHWNLESILMQVAQGNTAPTDQAHPGPVPRFPYIEATGARVNIKLGNEKMPFSLNNAEFGLWLPSPEEWRVRLKGKPLRTDSDVSDAGEFRMEGTLGRTALLTDVPVDLHASWRDAPLGEASRLLTGQDAGWRGTFFLELALTGNLGHAAVTSQLQFNDLRRADYVPSKTLDVTVDCAASSDVRTASVTDAKCDVPVDSTTPLTLTASAVDLLQPSAAEARTIVHELPLGWALDWVQLFSPHLQAGLEPKGVLNGEVDWRPSPAGWQGKLTATLPPLPEEKTAHKPSAPANVADIATLLNFEVNTASTTGSAVTLPPVKLEPVVFHPATAAVLTFTGQADANRYQLQLTGNGTAAQVRALADTFPPLAEGLDTALGKREHPDEHADAPHALAFTCSRLWNGTQTCEPLVLPEPAKPARPWSRRHH